VRTAAEWTSTEPRLQSAQPPGGSPPLTHTRARTPDPTAPVKNIAGLGRCDGAPRSVRTGWGARSDQRGAPLRHSQRCRRARCRRARCRRARFFVACRRQHACPANTARFTRAVAPAPGTTCDKQHGGRVAAACLQRRCSRRRGTDALSDARAGVLCRVRARFLRARGWGEPQTLQRAERAPQPW
jgi:hypothetical protein